MRAARLRRADQIARVRAEGTPRNDPIFSLRALAHEAPIVRVAVVSSRAIGGAVQRNRARRRLREAIRETLRSRVEPAHGADLVVVARPAALDVPAARMRAAIARELAAVLP